MPPTPTTGRLLPTTTTRTTATLWSRSSLAAVREHVTLDALFDAYYDCRKHKRSKWSAVEYELNYEVGNYQLWQELNNMTYHPTTSIAFCVTKPRLREVFAADFRDRIVHHLFITKILPAVERRLTDRSFACRVGKGTTYGVKKVNEMIRDRQGWLARCDIEGFFMSINKDILMRLTEEVVRESATEDTDWWLWLARTIVMHRPSEDCEIHGNPKLWDDLPDNKTLFKTNGMPIGNLPSQILANLYLADFDRHVISLVGENNYARYADDFLIRCDTKEQIHNTLQSAREWLKENRKLTLHPKKVCIQKTLRGVSFTGFFLKGGVIHAGKRLKARAMKVSREWSQKESHTDEERERLRSRYNSYCGLLKPTASRRLRRRMWRTLRDYEKLTCINMEKITLTPTYNSR